MKLIVIESIFSISDVFFLIKIVKNYKIHQNLYLKNNYQERIQDDIYKNSKNMVVWNFFREKVGKQKHTLVKTIPSWLQMECGTDHSG